MYDLKHKIKKVLDNYQTDFLYDFTLEKNRDKLLNEILYAVEKSLVGRIGIQVLIKQKQKSKQKKSEKTIDKQQKLI